MKTNKKEPVLLVDSHHGIYVPQLFAQTYNFSENFINYDEVKEDLLHLAEKDSQDSEDYWETWESVLDNAKLCLDNNKDIEYYLYQNEDLWAVPVGYESEDFFNS